MLTDIDHVGIAVESLEEAVERYRAAFGVEPIHRETVEDQGVEEVMFKIGTSYIQLLGARGPDTPVGKYLAARGEGIHHIAYRVDDIEKVLAHLGERGHRLVDEHGRPGSRGTTVAFLHPKALHGTLIELVQEG